MRTVTISGPGLMTTVSNTTQSHSDLAMRTSNDSACNTALNNSRPGLSQRTSLVNSDVSKIASTDSDHPTCIFDQTWVNTAHFGLRCNKTEEYHRVAYLPRSGLSTPNSGASKNVSGLKMVTSHRKLIFHCQAIVLPLLDH